MLASHMQSWPWLAAIATMLAALAAMPVTLVADGGTIDLNALNGEKNSAKGAGGK